MEDKPRQLVGVVHPAQEFDEVLSLGVGGRHPRSLLPLLDLADQLGVAGEVPDHDHSAGDVDLLEVLADQVHRVVRAVGESPPGGDTQQQTFDNWWMPLITAKIAIKKLQLGPKKCFVLHTQKGHEDYKNVQLYVDGWQMKDAQDV